LHPSTLAKRVHFLLLLAFIAFYFYGLGHLPLVGPDEPRYAQVAREMFLRGDWITQTLGGHTWFEKPALLYWMEIAAFRVFGVHDWSARLGPALCGVLTVVAIWLLTRKAESWTENEQTSRGNVTALVAASCLGMVVFSRGASFDIVITMTTTWALSCFLLSELAEDQRRQTLMRVAFYFCVGLSLLAKGLVGIVIPGGVIGFYYLLRREWPKRGLWLSLVGWPISNSRFRYLVWAGDL
jgi:4-amino-4-deoxy-L-arabinose transferase-like glycosyltransferase